MSSRVAIWNPASGSAPDEDKLRAALGNGTELVETTEDDPGQGQSAAAVKDGAPIVVACGGDGTVRACLDSLSNSESALAIVPLGTGNLLASNLGVDAGLGAAETIGVGDTRTIDLGRINGEAFAVMAGSGFDALMIGEANDEIKSRFGTIAYVFSGLKNLRSRLISTTVSVDGEMWFEGRTSMVLVGNFGEISGGLVVFPDAQPDDGLLDVAVMSANTLPEWASVAWRLALKRPQKLSLARRTQGKSILITHEEPRIFELDGETRDPAERIEIDIEPSALTIHQQEST